MALRIEEQVVRGEIDNRTPGRVIGKIWLFGREEAVELELEGNPSRDLAGHVLKFTNPAPKPGVGSEISSHQKGQVGDMTASRKVKIPECTIDELMEFYKTKEPFPWHWGNSLYLEWYSSTNGRVVVEAAHYQLDLDALPTWILTEEDEAAQQAVHEVALATFMEKIAISTGPSLFDEDNDTPHSIEEAVADAEEAAIRSLRDRTHAQLDRGEVDIIDFDSICTQERNQVLREFGKNNMHLSPTDCELRREWIESRNEIAAIAYEDLEGAKCSGKKQFEEPHHPLVEECSDLALKLYHDVYNAGWVPLPAQDEHPLREIVFRMTDACEQLAGALGMEDDADDWPPDDHCAGYVIVRLKEALNYLLDILRALDSADEESLATSQWRDHTRSEVIRVHSQVLNLLREARAVFPTGLDEDLGEF